MLVVSAEFLTLIQNIHTLRMKVYILICTILALTADINGTACNLEPFVQGSCLELTDLYSYVEYKNDCVFWQGCLLNGNHFSKKEECEDMCKQ
ncbi:uncharacterized protein Dsimw501_GD28686 [Drosophila simulans]|uniref:BPTI/Kunitz inhibitor domain-containing protein n=2 Tax=Drosophila simulans TaxID=7240 RepID=A0A0J9QVC8_DROSI|nr:uncharacterized protein Dsimw501_GD28686 [Drosophila simulans]